VHRSRKKAVPRKAPEAACRVGDERRFTSETFIVERTKLEDLFNIRLRRGVRIDEKKGLTVFDRLGAFRKNL
jgi:hypothetical protein